MCVKHLKFLVIYPQPQYIISCNIDQLTYCICPVYTVSAQYNLGQPHSYISFTVTLTFIIIEKYHKSIQMSVKSHSYLLLAEGNALKSLKTPRKYFLNHSIKKHTAAHWTCEAYGKGIVARDPK